MILTKPAEEKAFVLAPDDLHIKTLVRLVNTYDWQQKIGQQDIEKVCQALEAAQLR